MSLDADRKAHAIFTAALEQPESKREAMITARCEGDSALASRVRRLLSAIERDSKFLESPAIASSHEAWMRVPDAVGTYLVIGVLGTGGMATVYEAVQHNPNRRVALKVMRQSMTSTDAFLRFRLEAETLARLHHPGIAQIYEAGTAPLGHASPSPFFAMELVPKARPITEYARTENLPFRRRVEMFASVCDAVLHGHQNGIIHRDIKPGNVLVGIDGLPKVIDFGIARTFDSERQRGGSSITAQASSSSLIGTLSTMSPEQCTAPDSIDVRSDVYSLGVLLYELITDRPPHDLSKCSIPEAVRIISEDPAPDPSTFCAEARGDLAAIISKAMDKDRARRYTGAGALAADIRRWLAHEPVEARPPSARDHVRKFVRRNPPLAASLAAAVLFLIVGTIVSGRYAYLAHKARDAAIQRERDLEAIASFQESLLRDIDVTAMGDRLRTSIDESVRHSQQSPSRLMAIRASQGEAERDFAVLLQGVNFTSIAVRALSESVLSRYSTQIDSQFGERPLIRARLMQQLASTMISLGLYADAEPVLRTTLDIRRLALGDDHADTLLTLHTLGNLMSTLGRNDDAVFMLKEALARRSRLLGQDDRDTLRTMSSLAGAFRRRGDLDDAGRLWGDTLAAQRRVLGADDPDALRTLNNCGMVLAMQGQRAQAGECWRELLERRRRLVGEDHAEYRSALGNLGVLLQDDGKFDEARPLLEQALAADRRRLGDAHERTLVSMAQLASLLHEMGEQPAAETLMRECVAGRVQIIGAENPLTLRAQAFLALIISVRGDESAALQLINHTIEIQRRVLGPDHPDVRESKATLDQIARHAP